MKKVEEEYTPKALREVRQWKDAIQTDVNHLSFHDAVEVIAGQAHEISVRFGFVPAESGDSCLKVAEPSETYGG